MAGVFQHFCVLNGSVSVNDKRGAFGNAVQLHLSEVPAVLHPIPCTNLCVVITEEGKVKPMDRSEF